ncbi:hypothetical protein ACSHWI_16005, partial [Methylococcus sp. S2T]|uniref:hypothetical protein n=1 Tax=Methylococcus sp. S2T TaxID=3438967 RepID=UPI003EDAFFB7
MAVTPSLGFPRIGAGRELKRAGEACWAGRTGQAELAQTGRELLERHWMIQS